MKTIGQELSSQTQWDSWLEDGQQVLARKKLPSLLISGDEDGIFSTESAEKLRQTFDIPKEAHHMLEGVGHIPMLEAGEKVSQLMLEFLGTCSSSLKFVKKECKEGQVKQSHQ